MNPTNPVTTTLLSPFAKIALTLTVWAILFILLPNTPFLNLLQQFAGLPYLGYLNWFIPVGRCAAAMAVWWTAVVVYYGVSWILRQLGLIGM